MESISAVIIAQDEARNISRCLQSLEGVADEVVVVDSGSTDQTEALCTAAGARFVSHAWAGYAEQKNYANSIAQSAWILSIDADEALSDELRDSLLELKQRGFDCDTVYAFARLNSYCERWVHHGPWYPDIKTRLFPKEGTAWSGVVHEELLFNHPVKTVTLNGKLLHYSYASFDDLKERQEHYAALAAHKAYNLGKRSNVYTRRLKAGWTFLRNYLFKLGFLDGRDGFTICRMSAYYTFKKYSILHDLQHQDHA